jgi:hypothetical protein
MDATADIEVNDIRVDVEREKQTVLLINLLKVA